MQYFLYNYLYEFNFICKKIGFRPILIIFKITFNKTLTQKQLMKAYDIEIILSRQLAESLSIPIFITDTGGALLFYNEPAEEILGKRFEDTGEMSVQEWSTMFTPLNDNGDPLPPEALPLVQTLNMHTPAHGTIWIVSLKGEKHKISITSYPLIGRGGRFLGAVAIFWKTK